MPLDPARDYQIADAIEIVFPPDVDGNPVTYRRWTGTGNLTYDGQVYRSGGIAEIEDINLGASITDVTSITLAVTDPSDRSLFLDHDPGPSPCKVIEFYRTRPKDGAWGAVDGGRYVHGQALAAELPTRGSEHRGTENAGRRMARDPAPVERYGSAKAESRR